MVNSDNFSKRLEKIIDYYELNASSFADSIDVGRSSISHILSGRNKPSLDFVMKVVSTYSEVDLYWLLNGKGTFPKSKAVDHTVPNKQDTTSSTANKSLEKASENLFSTIETNETNESELEKPIDKPIKKGLKVISKVILLYADGSFESFEN